MRVIKFPRWTKWSIFTLQERTVEIKYLKYSNLARFEEGMKKITQNVLFMSAPSKLLSSFNKIIAAFN